MYIQVKGKIHKYKIHHNKVFKRKIIVVDNESNTVYNQITNKRSIIFKEMVYMCKEK